MKRKHVLTQRKYIRRVFPYIVLTAIQHAHTCVIILLIYIGSCLVQYNKLLLSCAINELLFYIYYIKSFKSTNFNFKCINTCTYIIHA